VDGSGGEAMGQNSGGCSPNASGAVGRLCSDRVTNRWIPRGFSFFPICPKPAQIVKSKRLPYLAPKIPNFCMRIDLSIVNNFRNCVDLKFQTETKLNILEQIQYLNF
jgi:hypothetical protein